MLMGMAKKKDYDPTPLIRTRKFVFGWNQEQLAEAVGVSARTIGEVERGYGGFRAVKAVADRLGVKVTFREASE